MIKSGITETKFTMNGKLLMVSFKKSKKIQTEYTSLNLYLIKLLLQLIILI